MRHRKRILIPTCLCIGLTLFVMVVVRGVYTEFQSFRLWRMVERSAELLPAEPVEAILSGDLDQVHELIDSRKWAWTSASDKRAMRGLVMCLMTAPASDLDEVRIRSEIHTASIGTRAGAVILARCWSRRSRPLNEVFADLEGDAIERAVALYALPLLTAVYIDRSLHHSIDLLEDDRDGTRCVAVFGQSADVLAERWIQLWTDSGKNTDLFFVIAIRDFARRAKLESLQQHIDWFMDDTASNLTDNAQAVGRTLDIAWAHSSGLQECWEADYYSPVGAPGIAACGRGGFSQLCASLVRYFESDDLIPPIKLVRSHLLFHKAVQLETLLDGPGAQVHLPTEELVRLHILK